MARYNQFSIGDDVRFWVNGKKVCHTAGEGAAESSRALKATIVGTSSLITNGVATDHIILGWKENPFRPGEMPEQVHIDHNVIVNDPNGNYRYRLLVLPEEFCEKWTELKPSIPPLTLVANATIKDANLGSTIRFQLPNSTVLEGTLIAKPKHSGSMALIAFTSLAGLPIQEWKGHIYTEGDPSNRLRYYHDHTEWEPGKYVASIALQTDIECEIIADQANPKQAQKAIKTGNVPTQTLADAKLGDLVKIERDGKWMQTTVLGLHPKSGYQKNWVLVGFTDDDVIPSGINYLGQPDQSIDTCWIDLLDRSKYPYRKALQLHTPCKILTQTEASEKPQAEAQDIHITINPGKTLTLPGITFNEPAQTIIIDSLLQSDSTPKIELKQVAFAPNIKDSTPKPKDDHKYLSEANLGDRVLITSFGAPYIEGTVLGAMHGYTMIGYRSHQKTWEVKTSAAKITETPDFLTYYEGNILPDLSEYEYANSCISSDIAYEPDLSPEPKSQTPKPTSAKSLSPLAVLGAALFANLMKPTPPLPNIRVKEAPEIAELVEEEDKQLTTV